MRRYLKSDTSWQDTVFCLAFPRLWDSSFSSSNLFIVSLADKLSI